MALLILVLVGFGLAFVVVFLFILACLHGFNEAVTDNVEDRLEQRRRDERGELF